MEEHDDDDRPWEEPGEVRRDFEPHRGPFLELLGIASLVCGILGCLCLPSLIAFPLGMVTALMAYRDLGKMRTGEMDPEGKRQTQRAQTYGGLGVVFSVFCSAFPLGLIFQRVL